MYYRVRCHHNPTIVFAIKNIMYYGADGFRASSFEGDMVINFTTQPNIPPSLNNVPHLTKYLDIPFKEIMVPWPDMEAPRIQPEFWVELHKHLISSKYEHVCFHCTAGHGRTGTALASMLIANAGYTAKEAVGFVREQYCDEAVESFSQTGYLKMLDTYFNNTEYADDLYAEEPLPSMVMGYLSNDDDEEEKEEESTKADEESEEKTEVQLVDPEEEEKSIIFD